MSQALAAQGSSETSSRALFTKNSQSFCADILHELSSQCRRRQSDPTCSPGFNLMHTVLSLAQVSVDKFKVQTKDQLGVNRK